jgi:hypothetical protein
MSRIQANATVILLILEAGDDIQGRFHRVPSVTSVQVRIEVLHPKHSSLAGKCLV